MSGAGTCPGPWDRQEGLCPGQGRMAVLVRALGGSWHQWEGSGDHTGHHSLPIKGSAQQSAPRRVFRADSSQLFPHQLPRPGFDSAMKCASYPSLHLCQTDSVFLVCYDWENFSGVRKISKPVSGVKGLKTGWMLLNKNASVQMKMYMERKPHGPDEPSQLCLHLGSSGG